MHHALRSQVSSLVLAMDGLTIGMPCSFPLTRKAKMPPMTTTMKGAMADTQNKFGFFFL